MEWHLKKRTPVHEKRYFRMQLYVGREGAKMGADLLKCKYVPPASGLPVMECTSVLTEVGRGSESRVWVEI